MKYNFLAISLLFIALVFYTITANCASTSNLKQMTLIGTFGLGEGDVTSTIYADNKAYDVYFPDGMEAKQQKAIEELVNNCSASQKSKCEIICLVQLTPEDNDFEGYIRDIISVKKIK